MDVNPGRSIKFPYNQLNSNPTILMQEEGKPGLDRIMMHQIF